MRNRNLIPLPIKCQLFVTLHIHEEQLLMRGFPSIFCVKNFSPHLDSRSTLRFDAADIFFEDKRYCCTTSYVLIKNL